MKLFFLILFTLNFNLFAYDKIDLIGQIKDPSLKEMQSAFLYNNDTYVLLNNSISIYNSSFTFISKFNLKNKEYKSFYIYKDNIYIINDFSNIEVYNLKGDFLFKFAEKGIKKGQLKDPSDLVVFKDNKIYIANTSLNRIDVYDINGIYLYGFETIKKDGLGKIKPEKIDMDNNGNIYISNPSENIIQKYDRLGKLLLEKYYKADALAVDEFGFVYIGDKKEGKIKELDKNLSQISVFGTKGKGNYEFLSFKSIRISGKTLLVADNLNQKILFLKIENSKKQEKLNSFSILDLIKITPIKKYDLKALSFYVLPEDKIIYYDEKARTLNLLEGDKNKALLSYGDKEGFVKNPMDIIFNGNKIYICDTENKRIEILKENGKYDTFFGEKTGFMEKNKEGKFSNPSTMYIDSNGKLYIGDKSVIQVFNKDGFFLYMIGPILSNFNLENIVDIKGDKKGDIYVLDSKLKKIIIIDSNGKFVSEWNLSSIKDPISFDYDNLGYFFVLDKEDSNVSVLDNKGNLVANFFAQGKGVRELFYPDKLKIIEGNLYVSDPTNNKIVSFKINYIPDEPVSLNADNNQETIDISWQSKRPEIIKEYNVLRKDDNEDFKKLTSTEKLFYNDKDLKDNTTYYYQIKAISITGEEVLSKTKEVFFKGKDKEEKEILEAETEIPEGNRAPLEILPLKLNYIFSANYKYYLNNPIGKIILRNNTDENFSNVKISFFLKDYMDFPSDEILPELKAKTSVQMSLKATLNNRILTINEDTPIQAQLILSYYREGKEQTYTNNQPIKILSKNAITWDNPERIANFITIKDSPIYSFSRNILTQKTKFEDAKIEDNILSALLIWENLSNITYLQDPVSPYENVKNSDKFITDTVQFPRNTLKLKSGDCDDLTVLLATLLESAGIKVIILDYPGHISLMFETTAKQIDEVSFPEKYVIKYEDKYYIPLESTMLGKSFYDSVAYASNMYKNAKGEVNLIDLRTAMSKFEPVTLPESNEEFKIIDDENKIKEEINKIEDKKFAYYEQFYKTIIKENPKDFNNMQNLGVLYAGYNKYLEAQKIFEDILNEDPYNAAALNNLGNIFYMQKDYEKANDYYNKALKLDPYDENIYLNIVRDYVKLSKMEDAKIFAQKASEFSKEAKKEADLILNNK